MRRLPAILVLLAIAAIFGWDQLQRNSHDPEVLAREYLQGRSTGEPILGDQAERLLALSRTKAGRRHLRRWNDEHPDLAFHGPGQGFHGSRQGFHVLSPAAGGHVLWFVSERVQAPAGQPRWFTWRSLATVDGCLEVETLLLDPSGTLERSGRQAGVAVFRIPLELVTEGLRLDHLALERRTR